MSSLWPLCHDDQLDNLVLLRAPRLLVVHGSHHVPPWNPAAGRRRVRDNFFHEAELGQFSGRASKVKMRYRSCMTNTTRCSGAVAKEAQPPAQLLAAEGSLEALAL